MAGARRAVRVARAQLPRAAHAGHLPDQGARHLHVGAREPAHTAHSSSRRRAAPTVPRRRELWRESERERCDGSQPLTFRCGGLRRLFGAPCWDGALSCLASPRPPGHRRRSHRRHDVYRGRGRPAPAR
eukprot:262207-Prymnesium_polylepis.2